MQDDISAASTPEANDFPLLSVRQLTVELTTRDGVVPVIDNLSFDLQAGGNISFVGESGCGKSMTALALMGLLPQPAGRIASGQILFNNEDLALASDARLREIRGNDISMISVSYTHLTLPTIYSV